LLDKPSPSTFWLALRANRTSHFENPPFVTLVHYSITLSGPLPPAVYSGEESIDLHIFLPAQPRRDITQSPVSSSSSSPVPIQIPPRHASSSDDLSNEDIIAQDERFFTPPQGSPTPSYFEVDIDIAPPSPTIAATEDVLSDSATEVYEEEPVQPFPFPGDIVVGGWRNLQDDLVNHIVRRIHDNPAFFPALSLQFEGQDTIFGEDRRALEGLHIVCRRIEQNDVERAAQADADEINLWDDYLDNARQRADILQAYDNVLRRNGT